MKNLKKKIKYVIGLGAFALSFLYLLVNAGKVYTVPFQKDLDIASVVSSIDSNDSVTAVLAQRKLYVVNNAGQVENIFDVNDEKLLNYFAYDVRIDGDSFIIYGGDKYEESTFWSAEKLIKTDKNGKLQSVVYQRDFDIEDKVFYGNELDFAVKDGYVYYLYDDNGLETLLKIPTNGDASETEPEIFAEFRIPLEAMDGTVDLNDNKLYAQAESGEIFCYDIEENTVRELKGVKDLPENTENIISKVENLSISKALNIKAILYYLSIAVIVLAALFGLFMFFKAGSFQKNRMICIITVFLIVSIYTLTNQLILSKYETAENKLSSIADMAIIDLEKYYDVDFAFTDFEEYIEKPEIKETVYICRNYIDDVCRRLGNDSSMYLIIYAVDKDKNMYLLGTTGHDEYIGTYFEGSESEADENIVFLDAFSSQSEGAITVNADGNSYTYKDVLGVFFIEERYLFDDNGDVMFVLETGADLASVQSESLKSAVNIVLNLSAILAFLWVLFDFILRYKDDIGSYIKSKNKRKIETRIKLGGIYFVIISTVLYLDYFLLVMVVSDIAGEAGALALAGLLAIPFTAARAGSWVGSLMASTIIKFLGERKTGIIASIITGASYLLLAYSCITKNIYLLSIAKFFAGMCLDSILCTLAEGLPYEIDDDNEKEIQISRIKDGELGAIIISLMLGGVFAQFVSYAVMYLTGVVGALLLLFITPLAFRTPEEEEEDEEDAPNAWLAFLKPRALLYLFAIVTVGVLLRGYEEYVFPLLSESGGLSDIELTNMGILANVATFIGIEQFLPEKKYKNMSLMVGAFLICGIAICLLVLNSTTAIAFGVLVVINFISRPIEDYQVLELTKITDTYGYDAKAVHENFYAISDGINVLQAPIIGALCSVSMVFCYVVLGGVTAIVPGAYATYSEMIKSKLQKRLT